MKTTKRALGLGMVGFCAAVQVPVSLAQVSDVPENYSALLGSFSSADSARDVDDGFGGMLIYGAPLSQRFALEANLSSLGFDANGGGRDEIFGFGADAVLRHYLHPRLAVFGLVGLGGAYEKIRGEDEVAPFANVGGGLSLGLFQRLRLRGEGRYYATLNDDAYPSEDVVYDARVNLGLELNFGEPARAPDLVETPAAVAEPEQPIAAITPLDEDRDGVVDADDACPGTPAGFTVDGTGCLQQQTVAFQSIQFEFDSDRLTPASEILLREIAVGLSNQADVTVDISGHTCALGAETYNLGLSERRASSVKRFLAGEGVAESRMSSAGLGEAFPIATNEDEAGRTLNRRVEFKVKIL